MPCYYPLEGWYGRKKNPTGRRPVVFDRDQALVDKPITVPCGRCIGCRLERSRQWATRISQEASLYDDNCFITLTYDDDHLPHGNTLVKRDLQLFFKRLRKSVDHQVRYYACGEYGPSTKRPHYHACIFNHDFGEKELHSDNGDYRIYTSRELEKLWTNGYSTVGDLTWESAAYAARYCVDKINGEAAEEHYKYVDFYGEIHDLEPEFASMSLKPGIGSNWFGKYHADCYPKDFITVRGRPCRIPKFYDQQLEKIDHELYNEIKLSRRKKLNPADNTTDRLRAKEAVAKAKLNLNKRVI